MSVNTHQKKKKIINEIHQGDYFGEIAIIFGSLRSANIDSLNYCTLANLNNVYFNKLCALCLEIKASIKNRALETYYDD